MSQNNVKHSYRPNEASESTPLNFKGISKDILALRKTHPVNKWWSGGGKRTPLREAILKMRGQLLTQE
jgi:hypothetical protein